jgi:hypothetical protein
MTDEPFALSTIPLAVPAQADYDTLYATVMGTERGRWFLAEYARRNRNADTERLLEAVARIEAVIRGDRSELAAQGVRIELLEMAKAIARTRAEVAGIKPEGSPAGKAADAPNRDPSQDILAAAERLKDIAWTMRERGLDHGTCDQIEAVGATILSAAALRGPGDRRAGKLSEALQHLERRINALLDANLAVPADANAGQDIVYQQAAEAGAVARHIEPIQFDLEPADLMPTVSAVAADSELTPDPRYGETAPPAEVGPAQIELSASASELRPPPTMIEAADALPFADWTMPAANTSPARQPFDSLDLDAEADSVQIVDLDSLEPVSPTEALLPAKGSVHPVASEAPSHERVPSMWISPHVAQPAPSSDEPADFLLEPEPMSTVARTAIPPAAASSEAATEIDEDLFTGSDSATPISSNGQATAPAAAAESAASDPLAALKAMSDEERIALFT